MVPKSKKSQKQTWSIYINTTLPKPNDTFLHVGVEKYYQEDGYLYIIESQKRIGYKSRNEFVYDLKHIKQIQVRKEKSGGFL